MVEVAELYDHQTTAISQLLVGKHIIIAPTGCLAKGTPVRLANGRVKPVERLKPGEELLSFDEKTREIIPNAIDMVVRSCAQPKPMIELSYDGERITTTYDHYFYAKDGYAPLYQLIWGALETSQRVQLQLLCKQYGQNCDDNLFWWKRSWDNEARQEQQMGAFKDSYGWKKCFSPSGYRGNLVEEPIQFAIREPHQFKSERQQGGKSRVLFKKIQCVSWVPQWEYQKTSLEKQQKSSNERRTKRNKELLSKIYAKYYKQPRKEQALQKIIRKISGSKSSTDTEICNWSIKIKVPAPYYTIIMRRAPYTYCIGRKHNYLTHNCGKGAISVKWSEKRCEETGKTKVLVVTTASKAHMKPNDFEEDTRTWCKSNFLESLDAFEVISWAKLSAWVNANWSTISEWVIILDEIAYAKAGVSSGRGKAFLKIAKQNPDWAGFTATPGETWLHHYPYFQAAGLVRNKTSFLNEFANIQTFKGYPEIVGWRNEEKLRYMWARISYAPDVNKVLSELPEQTHRVITFSKPKGYSTVLKTRQKLDSDDFLDTTMSLCHYLRQLCFTKEKQEWVRDFVENLGERLVIFYSYIEEGEQLEKICKKALPKTAKVWRIDGRHHEIPTEKTCGERDVILCQWQSGSEGLNLQFVSYWVSVSPTYSYATSIQARGRVRRIGSKKPVFYYYLKCEDCIESDVYKALKNKQDFAMENWCLSNNLIMKGEQ